jgi:hypothetical protein
MKTILEHIARGALVALVVWLLHRRPRIDVQVPFEQKEDEQ